MRRKYLLGATVDREIVFGEFKITTRNGYTEFTASFNCVRPFTEDECEDATEYYERLIDDCYDAATKYELCESYDCSPNELAGLMARDNGTDVQDIVDCSLYSNIINVDGVDYYFESGSCGQCDTREYGMDEYVNQEAYNLLHELWDEYHLKKVGDDVVEKVNKIIDMLEEVDEEEWIEDYIRRNF